MSRLFKYAFGTNKRHPVAPVVVSSATWVSLLATEEEITSWNSRKTTGPFASSGDFNNNNSTDASNPGEYDTMNALVGTNWASQHWTPNLTKDADGTVARSNANDPSGGAREQSFDMMGSSFVALMRDRETAGSGDAEATAIRDEILAYANEPDLQYSDTALWPKTEKYGDANPLFYHALWVGRLIVAYSNAKALVGANTTIENWFSGLSYLCEHEIHGSLRRLWPERKSDDYQTNRWGPIGYNGDTTLTLWREEADGTQRYGLQTQGWINNRRAEMVSVMGLTGALLDDNTLILEVERFMREWVGFGHNLTWDSTGDFNRADDYTTVPQQDLSYATKCGRLLYKMVDALYRKGYTTCVTQTTSIGTTDATYGTASANKSLEDCVNITAKWMLETITPQLYAPTFAGQADYRLMPAKKVNEDPDRMYYMDGWLTRMAAIYNRQDWLDACFRVGTPEGFYTYLVNDGGMLGTRMGGWDRFLSPWDDRAILYP